jgi:hypothetical protein
LKEGLLGYNVFMGCGPANDVTLIIPTSLTGIYTVSPLQ